MANNVEKLTIEKKNGSERPVLPSKQWKKVDEHLTIEFTDLDIKQ